ncbi:DUF5694 domain-containing protein [Sporosarcina sp. ZBG7A]|uniref:DUF5694 domain-containing protein n=1 Tax=Sporosarcina sp. ZBG7A TaxID=1582223 RepID=UPI00057B3B0A|nr:DUF5694 domain-containing protein [Sporosarcina sp. ZBG7A]
MVKEIVLVGTFHFEQVGELIQQKEDEVKELVDFLATYNPTKIALEWDTEEENELNDEYRNFNGHYAISEIQQIGFRLAQNLRHDKLYAVNWNGQLTQEDMTILNQEIQNSYPDVLKIMEDTISNAPLISSDSVLIDSYRKLNDIDAIKGSERMYISLVNVVGDNKEMIGFNFLNKFSERELMIFKNIVDISTNSLEERILLLIGSDHLWQLNKLFEGIGWNVTNPFLRTPILNK